MKMPTWSGYAGCSTRTYRLRRPRRIILPMIKHIVFWRLKEQAHGTDKATNALQIKQRLEALQGQIPGLLKIEVGFDFIHADTSSDVALYSEMTDRAALAAYQVHPLHQAVSTMRRRIR
jgi:hypothetical protein